MSGAQNHDDGHGLGLASYPGSYRGSLDTKLVLGPINTRCMHLSTCIGMIIIVPGHAFTAVACKSTPRVLHFSASCII